MEKELDASAEQTKGHPWLTVYQQAARDALSGYLGSSKEQDFDQLTDIISRFKRGDTHIWLKRMGLSLIHIFLKSNLNFKISGIEKRFQCRFF